nr:MULTISPECIES: DUF1349 domain-containing protein [unclassified Gluconobacter]
MTTDKGTDFWRETFYGFTHDSGHFYGMPAPSSFTAQLRIRAEYEKLYDQAGLMIRIDEKHWVKAGIELSDGRAMLSSVLTNGRSDWATASYEYVCKIWTPEPERFILNPTHQTPGPGSVDKRSSQTGLDVIQSWSLRRPVDAW